MAGLQDSEPVNITLFETAGSAVQGMKIRPTGGMPHQNDPIIEITADAHITRDSGFPTTTTVFNQANEVIAALNAKEQEKKAGDRLPALRVTQDSATNRIFVEGFSNNDVGRVHAGAAAATLIEAYNAKDMLSTTNAMVGIQKLADGVLIDSEYEAAAIGRLKPDTTIKPTGASQTLTEQIHRHR